MDTAFGIKIEWDRVFSMRVSLDPATASEICGMCGSCDGNPYNDWSIGPNTEVCKDRLDKSKGSGDVVSLLVQA